MLALKDVTISFGARQVVRIEEFSCAPGEIVGIVGESGSGKSVTASAVLGLAERVGARVTGSILLDGQEIIGASERDLRRLRGRRIAMIFQDPGSAFNPVLRVGDIFARTLRLHGESSRTTAHDRAAAALSELLLPAGILRRYPHELSGGQLQRVAIAIALALDAEILIADEPTSALDVTIQAEILDLLARLRSERGLAVLLITHDLAVVAEIADRIAVMREGSFVETGSAVEVLLQPQNPYTKQLLQAIPSLTDRIGT